ncbi:MAG TPA: hypothetical protein VGB26_10835 [Nitrospiria bacterium]|jgi:hypothetical protein
MSADFLKEVKNLLEIVIGPAEIAEKVTEFGFKNVDELLKANNLSKIPDLPSKEKLELAKEQNKALIFRISKDATGKEINLALLKEKFGGLIYSSWYLTPPLPIAKEAIPTGWALVDLDPLAGSTEKTYDEQKKFIEGKPLHFKTPAADAYDLLVTFKATGQYFRKSPNNGRTAAVVNDEPIKISHFDKAGMCISKGWGKTVKSPEIGATTEMILS